MKTHIIGLLFLMIIIGCSTPPQTTTLPSTPVQAPAAAPVCDNKDCFITSANDCKDITVTLTETAGVFRYSSKDCVFTKTLISLNDDETQEMKTLLQGKSLTCKYEKGKFDPRWATSLLFGTEYCEGELKDTLAKLILFD